MSISTRRFSLGHIAAITLLASVLTSSATLFFNSQKQEDKQPEHYTCNLKVKQMEGYQYIRPLLFVDPECESEDLASVKYKINALIDREKASGNLTAASIYLRSQTDWLSINNNEQYEPGSLFKVPILMAILKMNEQRPGMLDRVITYNQKLIIGRQVNFAAKNIEFGKSYTVRQLLEYMIKYSSNEATCLLEMNMDRKVLLRMFTDIGLAAPNMDAEHLYFTAHDYSLFMRAIYNAGYLNRENSEYAAELLSQCEFKDGLLKGLPTGTKAAHKFGETGNDSEKQLHESAIVYLQGAPYLLTVMTRGKDFPSLQRFMAETSQAVYDEMKAKAAL